MNPNDPNNQAPQNPPVNPLPREADTPELTTPQPTPAQTPESQSEPAASQPPIPATGTPPQQEQPSAPVLAPELSPNSESTYSDQSMSTDPEMARPAPDNNPSDQGSFTDQTPPTESPSPENDAADEQPSTPPTPPPDAPNIPSPDALPLQQTPPPTNHPGASDTNSDQSQAASGSATLAIASLVAGIIGLLTSWVFGLGIVFGLFAIALAMVVLAKRKTGKGLAIAGLVTGVLAVISGVIFIALVVFMVNDPQNPLLDDTSAPESSQLST